MEQDNKKKPRFFCQFCDIEVEQYDRQCKNCGKFFSSVNCANCGFVGESNLFSAGCPICGYAGTNVDNKKISQHQDSYFLKKRNTHKISKKINNDPLPLWTFIIPSLLLILVIILLFLRI